MKLNDINWNNVCIKACPYIILIMLFIMVLQFLWICNHYHLFFFNHDSNLVYYHMEEIVCILKI